MRLTRLLAPWCIAAALLVAGTQAGRATGFTCAMPNDLQPAINNAETNGNSLNVAGTCTGGPLSINQNGFTLTASSSTTIEEQINIFATNVTLDGVTNGMTINGSGVMTGTEGVIVQPGGSATLSGVTVENWAGDGVNVQLNASIAISGGTITGNTNDGVFVAKGGSAIIGFVPNFAPGLSDPVTISSNGHSGVQVQDGGAVTIDNGSITGNSQFGVKAGDGGSVILGSNIDTTGGSPTQISGNAQGGISASNAAIKIDGASITGNSGGPAISAILSALNVKNATVSVTSNFGHPVMTLFRTSLLLQTSTITGPANANTLVATGGSGVLMQGTMITAADATDATVLAVDGSTIESLGGNTIHNTAGGTAVVMTVANDSTFHQVLGAYIPFTPATDSILGNGTVQVQSNMELGTGNVPPSATTWTGAITVQQNSSFRLDGGISISGGVTLLQGSNGFFNKLAGGTNSAAVTCVGTDSSHVAGATNVSPAVTLVTTGSGCYAF